MSKYIVYWVITIITYRPCDNDLYNAHCYDEEIIKLYNKQEFDSLDIAIAFDMQLRHLKTRDKLMFEYIDKLFNSPPRAVIDTVYTNDFAQVFQELGR